ncbi:MAG TPA: hypothetical protein VN726_15640 [Hanamia sp.]|nr:hypothetical protein [Hanamia sp.]
MKKVIFIVSFLVLRYACFAQTPQYKNPDEGKVYIKPQIPPSFPGGEPAWQNFVATNLDTDLPAKNGAPAGTYVVTVQFIVGMDSVVSNLGCENDPHYGMCQEAIRVVKKSRKWTPAKQDGRKVNGFKLLPVVFNVK